jgi:hypothetical protein
MKMRCAKEVLFTLLAGLLAPQPLLAVDAPELQVEHSIVIDAPPEQVWEVVSDFNGLPRWLPVIESSRIILGKNREVGCIRELTRANGTKVQEKLIAYEPWNMSFLHVYRRPAGCQRLLPHHDSEGCRKRHESSRMESAVQAPRLLDR